MNQFYMNLHLFEGGAAGGAGAGAAPAAGAAGAGDGGEAAEVAPGVLQDGTQVDNRLAARMKEQARKRQARGEDPVRPAAQQAQPAEEQPPQEEQGPSLEDEWAEAKKGKFKELIGRDIQNAIQDRFKNQADLQAQLDGLQPMLELLMNKAGVDSVEELQDLIENDDELYEEEAEAAGMTVEGYRQFKALQEEHERHEQEQRQREEDIFWSKHFENLARQGEELKQMIPDFDLQTELQNETFRRLTMPNSGLTLEAAYYAVHHRDLEKQVMAYGIQRTQQQISQTLQANRARPVEGAMKSGQPADIAMDPRSMSREQRQKLLERARRGEKIIF